MNSPVLELFAKLSMDTSEVDKGLDDSSKKLNSFGSSLKSGLANAAKVGVKAFVAASGAVVAFSKQAIDAFGNYEQLAGGVEKLYGDASKTVMKNAEEAFRYSGMSMNEYMQNATTLSASLIKSLGGDTQKAAEITDVAMRAMSDNINTFGTDAEAVQSAFSGLSRQNYTMIDNLKLGYAGTAQGMLELINDSGVLGKTLTDTSQLAEVGFANMVLAIDEIQKQQKIWGTTASEALHTIEGTANATKKAWENVITAIGKGEGLDRALEGMSIAIFGDGSENSGLIAQWVPRIKGVLEGIGNFLVESAPLVLDNIGMFLDEIFPGLASAVLGLLQTLAQFIIEKIPEVFTTGMEFIKNLVGGINESLPEAIGAIVSLIADLLSEFVKAIPDLITMGFELIGALIEGIIASIPDIIKGMGDIIQAAVEAIKGFDWLGLGKSIIDGLVNGIKKFGGRIKDSLVNTAKKAWSGIKSFFGISSPSKLMRDTIGRYIPEGLAEGIEDTSDEVFDAMENLADGTVGAYDPAFDDAFTEKFEARSGNEQGSLLEEIRSLKEAILSMNIVLDSGALVGEITPAIDTQLGTISGYRGRGM